MPLKAKIEGRFESNNLRVSCRDSVTDYSGPTTHISADKDWLFIDTGDESCAMLNIEALPALRRALAQVSKALKATFSPDSAA